jgi:hypothetical protein
MGVTPAILGEKRHGAVRIGFESENCLSALGSIGPNRIERLVSEPMIVSMFPYPSEPLIGSDLGSLMREFFPIQNRFARRNSTHSVFTENCRFRHFNVDFHPGPMLGTLLPIGLIISTSRPEKRLR